MNRFDFFDQSKQTMVRNQALDDGNTTMADEVQKEIDAAAPDYGGLSPEVFTFGAGFTTAFERLTPAERLAAAPTVNDWMLSAILSDRPTAEALDTLLWDTEAVARNVQKAAISAHGEVARQEELLQQSHND
ncbi:MAG: hypothetical protein JWO35_434 [Candidatus Saccharibacteria bacterium]|nr:hypothetical protein [Candidatus Saccharibacteria bacterium]